MRVDFSNLYVEAGPQRKVKITVDLSWTENRVVFLAALSGRFLANGVPIIEHLAVDNQSLRNSDPVFERGHRRQVTLHGSIALPGLHAVERSRGDADVRISFDLTSMVTIAVPFKTVNGEQTYVAGAPLWNVAWSPDKSLARSDWLKWLKDVGFGDIELIELPVDGLRGDPPFEAALVHIRDAESAFRTGQYDTVLFQCRKAIEAMAQHAANGHTKKGFELVLAEAFGDDAARVGSFNGVIRALSELDHTLGRHAQYPPISVTRQEAEFALSAHARLLGLLSATIAARRERARLAGA